MAVKRCAEHSKTIVTSVLQHGHRQLTITGAQDVVKKIEITLGGYTGRNTIWMKMKWAMFGHEEVRKLRLSLESYKVALGIGLHVMSMYVPIIDQHVANAN